MKKYVFVFVILAFILAACGGETPPPPPEPTEVVEVAPEPTATEAPPEPTAEPIAIPTEKPSSTASDTVINQWLTDPQELFGENAEAMAENGGGQFGAGSEKSYNAEENVFTFASGEDAIWTSLNTHLDEFNEEEGGGEQAILIKFQPSTASSLYFTFMGPNEFGVNFWKDGRPSLFWYIEAWEELFEGDLVLEGEGWYYTLMAIDREGNFRSVVWEEGNPDNKAAFSEAFAERDQGDGYKNQSWKFIIGSNAPMTLNMAEYWVYTFSGFAQ